MSTKAYRLEPDAEYAAGVERVINAIQEEIHDDSSLSYSIKNLSRATHQDLGKAVRSVAGEEKPVILFMSGFPTINANYAAETDGPPAVVSAAYALIASGIECRILVCKPCEPVFKAAVQALHLAPSILDVVGSDEEVATLGNDWERIGKKFTHVIAAERPGLGQNNVAYNMCGDPIACVHFDPLFLKLKASGVKTIAFGDRGNEVGLGRQEIRGIVARDIKHGTKIACVTEAEHIIISNDTNTGVYGFLIALAALQKTLLPHVETVLKPSMQMRLYLHMAEDDVCDGVTLQQWKGRLLDTTFMQAHPFTSDGRPIRDTQETIERMLDQVRHLHQQQQGIMSRGIRHVSNEVVQWSGPPRAEQLSTHRLSYALRAALA